MNEHLSSTGTERTVERQIDLEAPVDVVWSLVAEADGWLADEGTLCLEQGPGALGWLVEDGVRRCTRVETVEEGRRIVFGWWDERGDGSDMSRVEITLAPSAGATRLVVRESLPTGAPVSRASLLGSAACWEVRLFCLASQAAFRSALVLV